MFSKRYESTEIDRRTWLHVPSGTPWSTSSDTHKVVAILKETSTKMYTYSKYSIYFSDLFPLPLEACSVSREGIDVLSTFPAIVL